MAIPITATHTAARGTDTQNGTPRLTANEWVRKAPTM